MEHIGIAYQNNGTWVVEFEGVSYRVKHGDVGDLHPVLYRGRDENRRVWFSLSYGIADVSKFA